MKKNLTQLIQENTVLKRQVAEYKQVLGGSHFVDDSLIKGGFHVVQTIQERNKIDCCHRKPGMRVVVVGDDQSFKEFELVSSSCKTNSWREIISSADESTVRLISDYGELGPDLTTQLHLNQKLKERVVSLQNILDNLPPPVDISGKANTNASNLLQTDVISWRDALNVYSKSETYSKSEVNTKQEIEGILEDYVTETTFRDAVSGLETSKLDAPSNTVTNTTTYPFLVLTKANGVESARIAAGDVGKNVANAALTSINGAGLTLGADWNITSGSGFYFGLKGLLDKSADTTWNRLIMTDASGRVAYTNGKNVIKSMPSVLTDAEKTAWKTEMNGGWTTNTMSVATITPMAIKLENASVWVTLNGANLNLNPVSFTLELLDVATNEYITIPNSQVQINNIGLSISFWFNFFSRGLKQYKIRLWNGVAYYTTPITFTVTNNVENLNINTVTWDIVQKPEYTESFGTGTGAALTLIDKRTSATGGTNSPCVSAKSSELIPPNKNGVIVLTLSTSNKQSRSANDLNRLIAGIVYSDVANTLINMGIVVGGSFSRGIAWNNSAVDFKLNNTRVSTTSILNDNQTWSQLKTIHIVKEGVQLTIFSEGFFAIAAAQSDRGVSLIAQIAEWQSATGNNLGLVVEQVYTFN